VDGPEATLTPERYRNFIAGSRGELSTAKHVYVATWSGWFSCRSACYLAAGRPVVVQDTGFSSVIPAADGLLPFNTLDEAAEALCRVETDYGNHAACARQVAAEHFDSNKVLRQLLADVMG
jgi:glycosyltransferase involved in cell wall biosynthesis